MTEKSAEFLIEALRQAAMAPHEQRLFRSGKLAGLFPTRTGAAGEAAEQALEDGLLDRVRSEQNGKTTSDWVRITPRGLAYLHDKESPVEVLQELRQLLQKNRAALPAWLEGIQQDVKAALNGLATSVDAWNHRLDTLSRRVDEALRRAEVGRQLPRGLAAKLPWAFDAIVYLDQRGASGCPADCSLPELYEAIRASHSELGLLNFHEGLRLLCERRVLQLLPFDGPADELPQPEHAIVEGARVYYHVSR